MQDGFLYSQEKSELSSLSCSLDLFSSIPKSPVLENFPTANSILPDPNALMQDFMSQEDTQPDSMEPFYAEGTVEDEGEIWGVLKSLEPTAYKSVRLLKPSNTGAYLIGRHKECDVKLPSSIISNRHCLIYRTVESQRVGLEAKVLEHVFVQDLRYHHLSLSKD